MYEISAIPLFYTYYYIGTFIINNNINYNKLIIIIISNIIVMMIMIIIITIVAVIRPTRARFQEPFPGDFFGNSTRPEGSSCIYLTNEIICTDVNDTVFTDGIVGDETGTLSPAAFHAWNTDSRLSFEHTTGAVRQLNLFFYHNPSLGIGLPQITFITTGSTALTCKPLQYTLLGNQDLSSGDATVRNVTIALTTTKNNTFFHIKFAMTSEIHQFAVSEVQLCSDEGIIIVVQLLCLMLLVSLHIHFFPTLQPLLRQRLCLYSRTVNHLVDQIFFFLLTQPMFHLMPSSPALWPTRVAFSGSGLPWVPTLLLLGSQMGLGALLLIFHWGLLLLVTIAA